METAPQRRLYPSDLVPFSDWYALRFKRRVGRMPSTYTTDAKRRRVARASLATPAKCGESFALLLSDRTAVESMLDTLSLEMTSGSLRHIVYALQDYGEWAKTAGLIAHCAVLRADIPPENPPLAVTVYTAAEIELLVNAARGRGLRWWAFVAFLADTGRRVGEALSIRWDWLKLDENPPYVALPWTKAARPQYVPLGRRLREEVFTPQNVSALRRLDNDCTRTKSPEDYVFPWRYSNAHARWVRYCDAVGVEYRGLHHLRHTKATEMLARGVPIQAVSVLLGHTNVSTTARYYHWASALDYAKYLDPNG